MPVLKRQKQQQRKHHSFDPPPLFWDKLTKLWLTKSALREANRRNKPLSLDQGTFSSSHTFAANFLRNCSPTCLQEIKEFSRCGGPDLSDIRNYPAPADFCQYSTGPSNASSEHFTLQETMPKPGSTTVYDRNFEDHITDHGVYLPSHKYLDGTRPSEPDNLAEIQRRIRAARPSLDISQESMEKEYKQFTELDMNAVDEQLVIKDILPVLEGKQTLNSQTGGGHLFNNFAHLTDGTLSNARPDFYHGARLQQLEPAIRKQLNDQVMPSTQSSRPIAPNFFFEAKGHAGSIPVVKRQACYNGALGARGLQSLQQHGHENSSKQPNDGNLGLWAHHPTRSANPDRQSDFVMTPIGKWSLDGSPESYRQGLAAYRNARDYAEGLRDDIIQQTNARYAAGKDDSGELDGSEGSI
ncbi:uncharacterized protein BDV14DRAFT_194195 [Aspergillus stella-maris]|uniref:uncharacterized protein n=1 Tax=Aspergillus stella-maris TaxID=1810926 RepID=UPI003CCDDC90